MSQVLVGRCSRTGLSAPYMFGLAEREHHQHHGMTVERRQHTVPQKIRDTRGTGC